MNIDKNILDRYLLGTCSAEEKQLVETWFAQLGADDSIDTERVEKIVGRIDYRIQPVTGNQEEPPVIDDYSEEPKKIKRFPIWSMVASAAAILLVFGILFFQQFRNQEPQLADISAPTGENSIIVFEDNTELELDKLKVGDTVRGEGYIVTRNEQGEIKYASTSPESEVIYNTVRTKAGGITSLILADGSKVWLNSKSEIRYPVTFDDEFREVALKGEAYFEIEKAKDHPFLVRSEQHTIKVLGTKFNVNNRYHGYLSTLLEGKIALTNQKTDLGDHTNINYPVILEPNESYNGSRVTSVEDASKVLDWKEGYFDLTDLTLEDAADKMAIWYDVTFVIEDDIKSLKLFGNITKDKSLRQVLELLKDVLPISYEIKDREIKLNHLRK